MVRALRWAGGLLLAILALIAAALVGFEVFGWNVLRGPIASVVEARTGRLFSIHGDLDVDLGLVPRVTVQDLELGNAPWVGANRPLLRTPRLEFSLSLPQLLRGEVVLPVLTLDRPQVWLVRRADGRASWTGENSPGQGGDPPRIRELTIRDGQLDLVDAVRDVRLRAAVSSTNRLDLPLAKQLQVTGHGRYNDQPFRLSGQGGSLFALGQRDVPYPLALDVRAGATRLTLKGALDSGLSAGTLDARITLRGPDTADLYGLLGVVLPNSPPYSVRGRLRRAGNTIDLDDLAGRIGDSDVAGKMRFDTGQKRVRMTADLHSERLDFDDLGSLLGAPPATGEGETASPQQVAQAQQLAREKRLLPDAPLHVGRLSAMDAQVRYQAKSVQARAIPLKNVNIEVGLEAGVLRLKPASFVFPQGSVELWLTLDGTRNPAASDLDLRVRDLRLDDLMPEVSGQPAVSGALTGRAQLVGRGNSVREVAAHADGRLGLAMNGGRMSHLVVELIGLDVAEALGVLVATDKPVNIRCAAGVLTLREGQLSTDSVLIDTQDSLITARGRIDLARETMDLKLETRSKDTSLLSGQTPVTLSGALRQPRVGIETKGLAARGAVAVALAALLTPVAAMLAFVDPGLAKDSDCASRLREAEAASEEIR